MKERSSNNDWGVREADPGLSRGGKNGHLSNDPFIAHPIWGLSKIGFSPNWAVGHMPAWWGALRKDLLLQKVSSMSLCHLFWDSCLSLILSSESSQKEVSGFVLLFLHHWAYEMEEKNPCHPQNSNELSECCTTHKVGRWRKISRIWAKQRKGEKRGKARKETDQNGSSPTRRHRSIQLQKESFQRQGWGGAGRIWSSLLGSPLG